MRWIAKQLAHRALNGSSGHLPVLVWKNKWLAVFTSFWFLWDLGRLCVGPGRRNQLDGARQTANSHRAQ